MDASPGQPDVFDSLFQSNKTSDKSKQNTNPPGNAFIHHTQLTSHHHIAFPTLP